MSSESSKKRFNPFIKNNNYNLFHSFTGYKITYLISCVFTVFSILILIYAVNNLDLMVEKHIELLRDRRLRDKMGNNARRHVETRFTWSIHCSRLEKVLEKVLENN